jgi:endonuclease YncB( thermonuclease family)
MKMRAFLFVAAAQPSLPAIAQTRIDCVASVIDGDSIEIQAYPSPRHRLTRKPPAVHPVRPASTGAGGQQAALTMADRIGRATVSCQSRDLDRYGRIVAVCFKGNIDLNRWMVTSGWANALR